MISALVTRGYGPPGTIALVVTSGYAVGAARAQRVAIFARVSLLPRIAVETLEIGT